MSAQAVLVQKLHSKHPVILKSMTYGSFITAFTQIPRYRQAFVAMPKATFDVVYERHLQQIPNVKQQSISKLLEEMRSPEGNSIWEQVRRDLGIKVDFKDRVDAAWPDEIRKLNMPEIGTFSQRTSGHLTGIESYARWADKVEKRNPEVVFDKDKMDTAFKFKAMQSGADKGPTRKEFEKMMKRCLGKESTEYWKDR